MSPIRGHLESFTRVSLYMNYEYEGLQSLGVPEENITENRTNIKEAGMETCSESLWLTLLCSLDPAIPEYILTLQFT